jgi:hypothetical protein
MKGSAPNPVARAVNDAAKNVVNTNSFIRLLG